MKNTDAQRSCRRSSVISPSTQSVGSRCSQLATPWLNARTEKTLRPSTSVDSTFTEACHRAKV